MTPGMTPLHEQEPLHEPGVRALRHVAALSSGPPVDPALRVTLNFHPDRLSGEGTVLQSLAEQGAYLSQFVTGLSNGALMPHRGGDRWRWEHRMFGGAYDDTPPALRPVYGALDVHRNPAGAAPRFGSAHLRLRRDTLARSTFCYPDSYRQPTAFAVAQRMSLVGIAAADRHDDPLDDYIEAQVHGPVRLDRDVEALVLDPSHRGTGAEAAAGALPCPLEWHGGFRLGVAELRRHPDYRGPRYVELGARIAEDGWLTPRVIGDARRTGRHDEQDLKRVWHLLARFGAPLSPATPARP
jgi:hypothetical protein